MRHLKSGRKLGRTASHRKALLDNLATEVFRHKSIITTTPKAKEARSSIERLITFAKKGDLAARRQVMRTVNDKTVVKELFESIAPKFVERNGGYTRIVKLGFRNGDNAPLAILELVGFEGVKAERMEKQRQEREERKKRTKKEAEEAAKDETPDSEE
ncbi:MAG TPA: 50S ribosomal protein L17 [bacterium]|jgi:large subunit ribosomal protein L17|nr:50S ribosomal protein L17 [bacterium]HNT65365.1 50S ribosomal protein L17 [bacterium]HOX86533.1 50S ribosomal protein L17 [bacterium]HPG46559.1 50S ribosomal protein L17 [bacterium]HPM98385.1 50S ribosomal protein L17 [bacterium]